MKNIFLIIFVLVAGNAYRIYTQGPNTSSWLKPCCILRTLFSKSVKLKDPFAAKSLWSHQCAPRRYSWQPWLLVHTILIIKSSLHELYKTLCLLHFVLYILNNIITLIPDGMCGDFWKCCYSTSCTLTINLQGFKWDWSVGVLLGLEWGQSVQNMKFGHFTECTAASEHRSA